MVKRVSISLLTLLLLTWLCGCLAQVPVTENDITTANTEIENTVTVVVTRDFGKELIIERDIEHKVKTSAMDALQAVAEVETKYGGGFISSINGIGSEYGGAGSKKKDWFFYINGIASKVGAGDCILQSGDVEHWDFRDWSYQQFVPAIIGDYPQPFWSGYGDRAALTFVVYEETFIAEAESLVEILKKDGIPRVSAVCDDQLSEEARGQNNLIIIAGPENGLISELNKVYKKLGFYAYLESGKITVLDAAGSMSWEYGHGVGIIQGTQNPWNPKGIGAGENAVWMITGTDVEGVKSAANALLNSQDELRYAFAAVVSEGEIVKIP